MLDVEGFILVGGASSRMGNDKSALVLGEQTVVERIAMAMSGVAKKISVVGSRPRIYPFPIVHDLAESWGPLGGIHAALNAAKAKWCFIIACDLPFVTSDLLERLLHLRSNDSAIFDAVVPIQADDYPQPLCAVYETTSCLAAAEQSIASGEHSPRALLDKVNTRYVPFNDLADLAGADDFFFNLNTPEHYERAKRLCQ
jgi:molybdopterin-guanine dinucleotide biosynthesis protein A